MDTAQVPGPPGTPPADAPADTVAVAHAPVKDQPGAATENEAVAPPADEIDAPADTEADTSSTNEAQTTVVDAEQVPGPPSTSPDHEAGETVAVAHAPVKDQHGAATENEATAPPADGIDAPADTEADTSSTNETQTAVEGTSQVVVRSDTVPACEADAPKEDEARTGVDH